MFALVVFCVQRLNLKVHSCYEELTLQREKRNTRLKRKSQEINENDFCVNFLPLFSVFFWLGFYQ